MANIMKERWIGKARENDGNDRIFKKYKEKIFQGCESELIETDPEFMERFNHFVFDEVVNQVKLDDKIGFMAILAALLGCQGKEAFRELLPAAMDLGVTPVEVKEIVYQAAAYLGMGRVLPFLKITNEVLTEKGVSLPLKGQAGNTVENRRRQEHRYKWRSSEKECRISGSPVLGRAGTSINGWLKTALGIITRETGLTTNKGR